MKIFGIIGLKNSGKTYFAQKIISKLCSLDLRVASIKHAHHNFDIDKPKTDSYLHRSAGSEQIIISSSNRWVKISELKNSPEKKLIDLISELENIDVVIVEGYKNDNHPKIEIIRDISDSSTYMFAKLTNITAIITDIKIDSFDKKQFKTNQINEIVSHILS